MNALNKMISKDERESNLALWSSPFQVGRKVVIKSEPPKARRSGFLYGTIHRIVEPPKKHRNGLMEVFLLDKNGETVGLAFPYWGILPKDAKFTPEQYEQRHPRKAVTTVYKPAIMPKELPPVMHVRERERPAKPEAITIAKRLRTR